MITQLYFGGDYYLSSRDSCRQCKVFSESICCRRISLLGRSDSQSLIAWIDHRNDIKTYEGDWTIVLARRARVSSLKHNDKTVQRGSYVHIREYIMQ